MANPVDVTPQTFNQAGYLATFSDALLTVAGDPGIDAVLALFGPMSRGTERLHPRLAQRAASWECVTRSISTAPLIYRQSRPTMGNKFYAGDAAAFIDPFVGDGISIALRSGRVAAEMPEFLFPWGSFACRLRFAI